MGHVESTLASRRSQSEEDLARGREKTRISWDNNDSKDAPESKMSVSKMSGEPRESRRVEEELRGRGEKMNK